MKYLSPGKALFLLAAMVIGCGGRPSAVNIELRKKNQELADRVAVLERQHEADQATIRAIEQSRGTISHLPSTQLSAAFTVHGLSLLRLTGAADWDASRPGDDGVKVYVVPVDQTGDVLKAAGSIVVEAFDLSNEKLLRLGRWEFSPEEAAQFWRGRLGRYEYALTCPWQSMPTHPAITLKVSFTDILSGRTFDTQTQVQLGQLPPATAPAAP